MVVNSTGSEANIIVNGLDNQHKPKQDNNIRPGTAPKQAILNTFA